MDKSKIKEIVDNHALWLKGDEGEKANLREANLCGVKINTDQIGHVIKALGVEVV